MRESSLEKTPTESVSCRKGDQQKNRRTATCSQEKAKQRMGFGATTLESREKKTARRAKENLLIRGSALIGLGKGSSRVQKGQTKQGTLDSTERGVSPMLTSHA